MKERLTGAIVLVALLVLLVPELLTGPGRSAPAAAVTKSTDGEGAQMRSYTITLAEDASKAAAPGPSSAAPSAPAPAAGSSGDAAPSAEGGAQPEAPAQPEAIPPPNEAAVAADASGPSPSPESNGSAAPSDASAPRPETPAPADPAPPKPAASSTGFAVQVGSFASRENAERLARDLKGKGFAATVSPTGGKKRLWRVRVGPEPDRAAAAALGAKLRARGQSGAVVPYP